MAETQSSVNGSVVPSTPIISTTMVVENTADNDSITSEAAMEKNNKEKEELRVWIKDLTHKHVSMLDSRTGFKDLAEKHISLLDSRYENINKMQSDMKKHLQHGRFSKFDAHQHIENLISRRKTTVTNIDDECLISKNCNAAAIVSKKAQSLLLRYPKSIDLSLDSSSCNSSSSSSSDDYREIQNSMQLLRNRMQSYNENRQSIEDEDIVVKDSEDEKGKICKKTKVRERIDYVDIDSDVDSNHDESYEDDAQNINRDNIDAKKNKQKSNIKVKEVIDHEDDNDRPKEVVVDTSVNFESDADSSEYDKGDFTTFKARTIDLQKVMLDEVDYQENVEKTDINAIIVSLHKYFNQDANDVNKESLEAQEVGLKVEVEAEEVENEKENEIEEGNSMSHGREDVNETRTDAIDQIEMESQKALALMLEKKIESQELEVKDENKAKKVSVHEMNWLHEIERKDISREDNDENGRDAQNGAMDEKKIGSQETCDFVEKDKVDGEEAQVVGVENDIEALRVCVDEIIDSVEIEVEALMDEDLEHSKVEMEVKQMDKNCVNENEINGLIDDAAVAAVPHFERTNNQEQDQLYDRDPELATTGMLNDESATSSVSTRKKSNVSWNLRRNKEGQDGRVHQCSNTQQQQLSSSSSIVMQPLHSEDAEDASSVCNLDISTRSNMIIAKIDQNTMYDDTRLAILPSASAPCTTSTGIDSSTCSAKDDEEQTHDDEGDLDSLMENARNELSLVFTNSSDDTMDFFFRRLLCKGVCQPLSSNDSLDMNLSLINSELDMDSSLTNPTASVGTASTGGTFSSINEDPIIGSTFSQDHSSPVADNGNAKIIFGEDFVKTMSSEIENQEGDATTESSTITHTTTTTNYDDENDERYQKVNDKESQEPSTSSLVEYKPDDIIAAGNGSMVSQQVEIITNSTASCCLVDAFMGCFQCGSSANMKVLGNGDKDDEGEEQVEAQCTNSGGIDNCTSRSTDSLDMSSSDEEDSDDDETGVSMSCSSTCSSSLEKHSGSSFLTSSCDSTVD